MALLELAFPASPPDINTLSVRHFEVHEALSSLFEVSLVAMSPSPDLDLEQMAGKPARFTLDRGDLGRRTWTGVCFGAELLDVEEEQGALSTYRVSLAPVLWLLTQRRNHRIFQHLSAPEIAAALLGEWRIEHDARLAKDRFPKLEYRVQYGETDFAFLSRILEEAGIGYFFVAGQEGTSRLVLADAPELAEPRTEGPIHFVDNPNQARGGPYVTNVLLNSELKAGAAAVSDYDFRKPFYKLIYKFESPAEGESRLERYEYLPGSGRIDLPPGAPRPNDTPAADDKSFARIDEHAGYGLASTRLQGERFDKRDIVFTSNVVTLAPGVAVQLEDHPKPQLAPDRKLLVIGTEIEGDPEDEWNVAVTAAFADVPIRPPRKTPRPRIDGLQSAIVVGPPGQEIHTDEFGRVRVRFHWDREGGFDDERTCWVRVGEGWSGSSFGMIATPRVGHEVLVAFYEGNPDEPLVVGRVYDAVSPPPFPLPAQRTRSGWRSQASPGGNGHHELSFEDRVGHELLYLRSERDLHKMVKNEEVEATKRDRTIVVAADLANNVVADDEIAAGEVHSVQMAEITETARVADQGDPHVLERETLREMIPGRITITTGGATIQLDGPDIVVTAESDVFIKAGKAVDIRGGPYVQINPPLVGKRASDEKKDGADRVVWFKLVDDKGQPMPDVTTHVAHADGSTSTPQKTDGRGMVRFPVDKSGKYELVVGAPAPKKKAAAAAAPEAPAAETEAAPAPKPASEPPPAPAKVKVGETPAQPVRAARPTQHAVPIEIQILSPKPATAHPIDPGKHPKPDPSMPTLLLHAKVLFQGKEVSTGSLQWEFHISGKYRVRDKTQPKDYRLQEYKLPAGSARTAPGEQKKFQLAPGEIVGGDLEISVTYEGGPEVGGLKKTDKLAGLKVVGKNAARADVEALIASIGGTQTWALLRIFCHESVHRLEQFKKGEVLYGPPAGVGIVQRDPEGKEWKWPKARMTTPNNFFPRIFWDWKKNIIEGVEAFRSDYMQRARNEIAGLRKNVTTLPEASEEVILRSAIRHYNGGNEYQEGADGKHYVVSPWLPQKGGGRAPPKADRLPYVNQVLADGDIDATKYPIPEDVKAKTWPRK